MSQKLLFLDIETVSECPNYNKLDDSWKELWALKSRYYAEKEPNKSLSDLYSDKAAIYAEFGRIICISLGLMDDHKFRVKSLLGDESDLLKAFFAIILKSYSDARNSIFVGHNIKEFDIPYICRRAVINKIDIPTSLELSGRKPWEINHIHDTLEMWKFGDYKHFTSLDLLARCLNLPSSKQDISGKDVGRVYWEENDIERISKYCQQDVVLTARVYRRLKGEGDFTDEQIVFI